MYDIKTTPVLVIGSGISGLFTALKLAESGLRVLLISKTALEENNSRYAQGGIAAVLPQNPDDSLELHLKDTLLAGAGLCDEAAARSILAEGYPAIADLLRLGVPFDKAADDTLALTREAAHSTRRIIHAGGDATGKSVEMTLIRQVQASPLIDVLEACEVVELLARDNRCYGCRAVSADQKCQWLFFSQYTVLATGGVGQLYGQTTNPAIATGDGIALAHSIGAKLADMEFVQFHPTAFYADGRVRFLISEALRGEGGILRNAAGETFAQRYHPDGELAPRDIVTRAIYTELQASQSPCVYLDITHLPPSVIENRFPTILAGCQAFGVDIRRDLIPVTPAAHYMMGGVAVDIQGRTTVENLYAVGEVAHTGLHGANRLASNSLLECVVLARRVAAEIANVARLAENTGAPLAENADPLSFIYPGDAAFEAAEPLLTERIDALQGLMWSAAGIVRTGPGLAEALAQLTAWKADSLSWRHIVPLGAAYSNQWTVARLILEAALAREQSCGAHFRADAPVSEATEERSPCSTCN